MTAREQPKWYQLRFRLANQLVKLAQWIQPENPEVKAFYVQGMLDMSIAGKHITRVDWADPDMPTVGEDGTQ